jgi:hypothetical protein
MDRKNQRLTAHWAAAALSAIVLGVAPGLAIAQGGGSTSTAVQATVSVTVVKVDPATRHIIVKTASGENVRLKVDPAVRNLENIKAGDKIKAVYYREIEFGIVPRGKPLPKDTDKLLAARAAKGDLPAGLIANHMVVTGNVLGIDMANSRVKVANPKGGEVHTFDVVTEGGKQLLPKLKVGDSITAEVTEGLLVAVTRS